MLVDGRTLHAALKFPLNMQINVTSLQYCQKQRNGKDSKEMRVDRLGRMHDGPPEVTGGAGQNIEKSWRENQSHRLLFSS